MSSTISSTIAANLAALVLILERAHDSGSRAVDAMTTGERNLAIGNLLDLEQLLPQADALYRAIVVLHCDSASRD